MKISDEAVEADGGLREALVNLRLYCGRQADNPDSSEDEQVAYDDIAIQLAKILRDHPAVPYLMPDREALAEALYLHDNRNALIQAHWSKALKLSRQQYLQRADAMLALFGSEVPSDQPCLGDGVCTNPKCPVHGIKEEPSDQPE